MANKLPQTKGEFLQLIERVDRRLQHEGVPIPYRTIQALGIISEELGVELELVKLNRPPDVRRFDEKELSWHIYCWYEWQYGKKLEIDLAPGRTVFLLRGDVWVLRLPRVAGYPSFFCSNSGVSEVHARVAAYNILDFVDELSTGLKCSLTSEELLMIQSVFELAYQAFVTLEMKYTRPFVPEVFSDHDSAVHHLQGRNPHYGQSKWSSHQAAEKIIKAFIATKKRKVPRSHNLVDLAKEAEGLGLPILPSDKLVNAQCSPSARYGQSSISCEKALLGHYSALELSLLTAPHI